MQHFFVLFTAVMFAAGNVASQSNQNIELLYNWQDPSLTSSSIYDNTYNEVWGYNRNGREYAIIGSTAGTHIFDITNSAQVDTIDFIAGAYQGSGVIHRDYHHYKNYLYIVCDEGPSSLQIADLSYLPDSVPVVYDDDSLIKQAHNIFIDSSRERLYAAAMLDGNDTSHAMTIYSLSNPLNPALIGTFDRVSHVHDLYVYNDTAFCNAGYEGLVVYDFSSPSNPVLIDSFTNYPDNGYNHSGWVNRSEHIYVFTDENHGYDVKICDISNVSNIQILATINTNVDDSSMAHNPIIKGNLLYISYYHDGTYIYDLSDPSNPSLFGYYDTYPPNNHTSYRGNWGVYPFLPSGHLLASDMQNGLFVFDTATTSTTRPSLEHPDIRVYPNPSSHSYHLTITSHHTQSALLRIQDLTGQVLQQQHIHLSPGTNKFIIHWPRFAASGVYYLSLQSKEERLVKKIIKAK